MRYADGMTPWDPDGTKTAAIAERGRAAAMPYLPAVVGESRWEAFLEAVDELNAEGVRDMQMQIHPHDLDCLLVELWEKHLLPERVFYGVPIHTTTAALGFVVYGADCFDYLGNLITPALGRAWRGMW